MKDDCQLRERPLRWKRSRPGARCTWFRGFTGLAPLARGSVSVGSKAPMALDWPMTLPPDFVTNLATPGLAIQLLSGHLIGYHTAASDQTAKAFHREQTRWSRTCFPTTDPRKLECLRRPSCKDTVTDAFFFRLGLPIPIPFPVAPPSPPPNAAISAHCQPQHNHRTPQP